MFEQKEIISLDQQSFKALAGTKRIAILKSLNSRNKTQSELSQDLKLSVPTIKEHLNLLANAGLIEEINDGHKWKYFKLTRKGQKLMKPNDEMKIMLVLSTSFIAMLAGIFSIMLNAGNGISQAARDSSSELMKSTIPTAASASTPLQESAGNALIGSAVQKGSEASSNTIQQGTNFASNNLNLINLIQNHFPETVFITIMLVIFVIFLMVSKSDFFSFSSF